MLAIYKGRQKRGGFVTGGTYKIETRLACTEIGRWIAVKETNERNGYEKLYLNVEDFLTEWRLISGEEEGMSFMRYNVGDKVLLKKSLKVDSEYPRDGGVYFVVSMEEYKQKPMTIESLGRVRPYYKTSEECFVTDDMIDHERTERLNMKKDINWLKEKLFEMRDERFVARKGEDDDHWVTGIIKTNEMIIVDEIIRLTQEVENPKKKVKKYRVLVRGGNKQAAFLHKKDNGEVTEGANYNYYLNNRDGKVVLTEKEIKDFDEWYWRFAVEVKDEG